MKSNARSDRQTVIYNERSDQRREAKAGEEVDEKECRGRDDFTARPIPSAKSRLDSSHCSQITAISHDVLHDIAIMYICRNARDVLCASREILFLKCIVHTSGLMKNL